MSHTENKMVGIDTYFAIIRKICEETNRSQEFIWNTINYELETAEPKLSDVGEAVRIVARKYRVSLPY